MSEINPVELGIKKRDVHVHTCKYHHQMTWGSQLSDMPVLINGVSNLKHVSSEIGGFKGARTKLWSSAKARSI